MKLEDRLSPLQPHEPTDEEIARLLTIADRRTRRRRTRIAGIAVAATATASITFAALPSEQAPTTVAAILTSTAQTAAEQDAPAPWTGYRYLESIDRRETATHTIEATERWWSDSEWQGRRTTTTKLVSGTITAPEIPRKARERMTPEQLAQWEASRRGYAQSVLKPREFNTPEDIPNLYGDAGLAKVPLNELPTDPDALGKLLFQAHEDGRWSPGGGWDPAADRAAYQVLRDIVLLLARANVTPDQRAALITVLSHYDGATPLPEAVDRRGRSGRGVTIGGVTIIFDPDTSELLEWSERGQTETFLAAGRVTRIGELP
ncbi:hypothetical protein DVA67_004450 [Solirubrobacter sp. CPCC 204708]|uniref:Tat pathway signal protein n=1 Tax=Solirubrobacter deserti TaxID=2282478 RepID=A0ABT4RH67_9ACTN|nr:hypothetical protein [Solirubrobacter deserti]MBE2315211.1 hypothetical protein [Solirubrobacter deserti]MDA0137895.1 hypothetical protein [Solirubrobacter deserti]